MGKIFVSYTKSDLEIAEWIAWELEAKEYSVVFQAWGDLNGNWILEMDKAMRDVERTVAVLSNRYLESLYAATEWANAVRLDPTGEKGLLIPVRVEKLNKMLDGWLAQISYVDFVNTNEDDARELLYDRMAGKRTKPSAQPGFYLEGQSNSTGLEQVIKRKPSYRPLKDTKVPVAVIQHASGAKELTVSPAYTFLASMDSPVSRSVVEAIFGVDEVNLLLHNTNAESQNYELLEAEKGSSRTINRRQALIAGNYLSTYLGRNYGTAVRARDLNIALAKLHVLAGDIKGAVRMFRNDLWNDYSASRDGESFSKIFFNADLSSTDRKTRSYVLNLQGLFAKDQGDVEAAIRRGKSALKNVDGNNPLMRAIILQNLAEVQMEIGDVATALSSIDSSVEILRNAKTEAGRTWRSAAIRDRARMSLLVGDVIEACRLLDNPQILEHDADFALRSMVSDRALLAFTEATTYHANGDSVCAIDHIDNGIQLICDAPGAKKEEEDFYRQWILASLLTKGAEVKGTTESVNLARAAIDELRRDTSVSCRPMKKYECTMLEMRVDLTTDHVDRGLMQIDHRWTRLYQETQALKALAAAHEGDRRGAIAAIRQIENCPFHIVKMDLKHANEFLTLSR